jgi:hypothetical protein
MKTLLAAIACLMVCPSAPGGNWYAAPNAALDGNGRRANPWPLRVALSQTSYIRPGDTLYLRGGTFYGPAFFCYLSGTSSNYITVRSFPGEWAVITDGTSFTLNTDLPGGTNGQKVANITFIGSEVLPDNGYWVKVGTEISYVHSKTASNSWELIRGYNITNHTSGELATVEGDFIDHSGSYVRFMEFEITGSAAETTNRVVDSSRGSSQRIGLNFASTGVGNKAINLIIHEVGHPAIGFWLQGQGSEINGCLLWGNGIYDTGGTWIRGNGVYAQNSAGLAKIKNLITFRNFTDGAEVFGETGPVRDFQFLNNIAFANASKGSQLAATSGSSSTSNTWFVGNVMLGSPGLSYVSLSNTAQFYISNITVNGTFSEHEHWKGVVTNNTAFMEPGQNGDGATPVQFATSYFSQTNLNMVWDFNTYYLGEGTGPRQWFYQTKDRTAVGGNGAGNLTFSGDGTNSWQAWSGFDAHSAMITNWPTDYLRVEALMLDYDRNRWHISVINMTSATNATLDLNSLGFTNGQLYELRDAQNYFTVIDSGTNVSGNLSLPLTLTNVADIQGINHYTNKHTNVDSPGLFNAFVLRRLISNNIPPAPVNLRTL